MRKSRISLPKDRQRRHAEGWEYGGPLVQWLNVRRRDSGRERLKLLLEHVKKLHEVSSASSLEAKMLVRTVGQSLKVYLQRPICFVAEGDLDESDSRIHVVFEMESAGKHLYAEQRALSAIMRLSERELLRKVCRCEFRKCGAWFYAGSDTQKFCSPKCRKAYEQSSPEYREYQRKQQAKYYVLNKTGRVKQRDWL